MQNLDADKAGTEVSTNDPALQSIRDPLAHDPSLPPDGWGGHFQFLIFAAVIAFALGGYWLAAK